MSKSIPQLTEKTSTATGDLFHLVRNSVDYKIKKENIDVRPYKSYVALLTQAGTAAPTAIVLENNLGGTAVWTRASTGLYQATLTGVFTINKTAFFITNSYNSPAVGLITIANSSADAVGLITFNSLTGAAADAYLDNTPIEIRVYT